MNPERWQHIERLFHGAIERAPAERSAYLAAACVGDDHLRDEVDSLITAHKSAGDFLETPAIGVEALAGHATFVAGQTFGHYRILDLLGEGGMGEVYLAEDTRLGRKVALKLLPGHLEKDARRLRRFEQEARAAAALSHPNVCVIHDVDETPDGHHFITMEHVEGETLRERIRRGRMSLEESLGTAIQVASALTAAHAAGIVHRDIKPENIMVRPDGQIKVVDFGLAKLTQGQSAFFDAETATRPPAKTEPGMILGTVSYMSPEQVRRSLDVDERADIWSQGVVLYEMVAGRLPFDGATPSHTIVAITDHEPPPLSAYVQDVPQSLEQIVKRALVKDPAARYQTASQMLTELKELNERIEVGSAWQRSTATESARSETVRGNRNWRGVALALATIVVTVAGIAYFSFSRDDRSDASLAILPLVNASADPNMEYLSDGITESLINSLSQLPQLRVAARTSVFRYKGGDTDPQEIGRDLKVKAVLTGHVVQRGDMLVIQVELVDTADGSQLWGQQYIRKIPDILGVQQEISREIAATLRLRLTGEQQRQVVKSYTQNPEAYRLYLRGRQFWNQRTKTGLEKAIELFQQAIDLDQDYALAYSGLADSYTTLGYLSSLAPDDSFPLAKTAALKALALDPTLAEAHASLAYARFYYDWDWDGAESEFQQAIERSPNYATAHHWYSVFLTARERHDDALVEIKTAEELDPDSLIIATDIGFESYYSGRYDQAIKQLQSVLELNQNFPLAHLWLGRAYQEKEMYQEAIAEYEKAEAVLRNWPPAKAAIGNAYGRWGKKAQARRVLDELHDLPKETYVTPYGTALIYASLGEKDQAFAALNGAYLERSHWLMWLKLDPRWGELRSDPRFADLARRIGLPK